MKKENDENRGKEDKDDCDKGGLVLFLVIYVLLIVMTHITGTLSMEREEEKMEELVWETAYVTEWDQCTAEK